MPDPLQGQEAKFPSDIDVALMLGWVACTGFTITSGQTIGPVRKWRLPDGTYRLDVDETVGSFVTADDIVLRLRELGYATWQVSISHTKSDLPVTVRAYYSSPRGVPMRGVGNTIKEAMVRLLEIAESLKLDD